MKYSIFELLEDPDDSEKELSILKDEAAPRGWEDCKNNEQVQRIVVDMHNKGFVFVANDLIGGSGPLGKANAANSWGRALYFKVRK
jgi:hypothetical protein